MTPQSVTIIAVGDIAFGELPVTLNHGVNTIVQQRGCDFLFLNVAQHLKGADIVCGNLEGVISPKAENDNNIHSAIFWGAPECAQSLKKIGFNCLFLANNHNAQHGKVILESTCSLLNTNNILWTGFNKDNPQFSTPAIFRIKGIKTAFLAYCETQQYNLNSPILPIAKIENVARDVEAARQSNDIIVVSLHWGDEFIDYPSPKQIELAHFISDLGVHLILGHHSHIVQGFEIYNNSLIAYSLGNFVNDLWPKRLRESVILKCTLNREGVVDFSLTPIIINKLHQPTIYPEGSARRFLAKITARSKIFLDYDPINAAVLLRKYHKDVRRLYLRDRINTTVHYIMHLPLYDKRLLFENIILMLKRRIYKVNI